MNLPEPDPKDIFAEALRLKNPAERAAYLERVCAGHPTVRQEVESLLNAYERAGVFLQPTIVLSEPDVALEHPGTMIGRYKLLEQIGEGGFGVVWMAEQEEPVRRRVALKIIKLGMDTREVVARFDAERQALAIMDHPNIADVFDGGATDTGRPYFVMELVKGVPITDYCDANKLPTGERLELFMQVCHAVQHAHQKGVIHRDLKPSNILVTVKDDRPVPKVIDFGVAKATQARLTEKTVFTRFQQWIGTPAYMSPEQAGLGSLDVDTRSDVYSLGVLLYELLTGRTPFDTSKLLEEGYEAVMRTVREVEPPKPSTRLSTLAEKELSAVAAQRGSEPAKLNRLIRGDLDWIVMKAIDKDRTRRYETASDFARDIQRHLDDEPVLARPPSTAYQMQKAWRRNKVTFTAGAVVIAALTLGIGFSTWQAVRATEAEAQAKYRLAESKSISQFLTTVFQSPDPARDGRTITVAEILGAAAKMLETDLASQPARRASLRLTLGETYFALGLAREAIPLQEKARDYYRAAPHPEYVGTFDALSGLAASYSYVGRREEALKLREEVLALSRKVLGPKDSDTLKAMSGLAASYFETGRRGEALKLQEEVLALSRKVNGPEHPDTLMAMHNLAISYLKTGRVAEAIKLEEEVLPISRKVLGPEHPGTLRAMENLAGSYFEAGRAGEALKLREELLPLRRKLLGPEHSDTLGTIANLAISYFGAGRREVALKLQEEVLALHRKVNGPEHPDALSAMANLAVYYGRAGRVAEALKLEEELLALRRKVNGPEHPDTLSAMGNLARSFFEAGRRDEALKLGEDVVALRCKVLGPEHPDTLKAISSLATSYFEAGRREEALKLREEVLALSRKVNGPEHPDTLGAMANLAISYLKTGRVAEVIKLQEEVLPISRKVLGPEHPGTLKAMSGLAGSYFEAGRAGEAIKLQEEVLVLNRKVNGPEHPDTLGAMNNLANSYFEAGRVAEALKPQEEVLELSCKVLGLEHPDTLTAMHNLAISYFAAGRREEALKLREGVLPLSRKVLGSEHPNTLERMTDLAISYAVAGRVAEAIKLQEEVLELSRKVLGLEHPDTINAMKNLAISYSAVGRRDEATKLQQEAAKADVMRLKKSADQGNADAQYRLGLILYEGKLVAADRVQAGQWILLATAAGNSGARNLLKEIKLFLTDGEMAEARKRADGFKPVNKSTVTPQP